MLELNQTAHKILDSAERFTQLNGFNAFSYKDLQAQVGVKTSSIHYYFPTKHDLAQALIERYQASFEHTLIEIEQNRASSKEKLEALGQCYISPLKDGRFCMCGMLASDMAGLPESVNSKVNAFFEYVETWIKRCLEQGVKSQELKSTLNIEQTAAQYLALLEGGMLIARTQKDPKHLEALIKHLLAELG
ncbi:TetR/AcrR family transcriptional regulator [Agaribacterium sp. ZY112]|uniref:TetR/AcrR family transcriptional regulator n=1 Tax=Agaribacterium sp. ZY112 TaxID=3233574 RepID=UPI003526A76F